ncbi:Uncharacterised protein [Streptococcus anginosus]|nr:Uncharacterised protein [Streptococcus anginosus]
MKINELGQPIGDALPNFKPGDLPKMERLEGRYVIVECLSKDKHGANLYEVYGPDSPADMWTYLFQNPVQSQEEWSALLDQMLAAQDRFYYAIVDKESGKALGTFALMRINRGSRVIEVGSVTYSPQLKRTRLATEAQYLLARYVFDAATSGNAMHSINLQDTQQKGLVLSTKALFVRQLFIKGVTETLTG